MRIRKIDGTRRRKSEKREKERKQKDARFRGREIEDEEK